MSWASSSTDSCAGGGNSGTTISALPPDVLTHILSLLDGPTLASASCASAQLRSLSAHPPLWRRLCSSSWPSTDLPPLSHLISDHRSFFSDAFSDLPLVARASSIPLPLPHHLVSAVDLRCGDEPIISTVLDTKTHSTWFLTSPFRIDALDCKDPPPPPLPLSGSSLAAELSLSWIVIDTVRRRAANLSSLRPVSVQRHWFSGETQVRFATIVDRGSETEPELVQCGVMVTCAGYEGERDGMQVREVCLQVEDMDGMNLNGEESLGIFQRAMEGERRIRRRDEEGRDEMRERFLEYSKMKMERKERRMKREGRLDMACLVFGLSIFTALFGFISSI